MITNQRETIEKIKQFRLQHQNEKPVEMVKEKQINIPINIWDDYYEDDHIPEGQKQETYIYVEDSNLPMEFRKECLEYLLPIIRQNVGPEVRLFKKLYDSKLKYPKLTGEEHEHMHFARWEIRVENMTHKVRHELVKKLNSLNLSYNKNFSYNIPFKIYSES